MSKIKVNYLEDILITELPQNSAVRGRFRIENYEGIPYAYLIGDDGICCEVIGMEIHPDRMLLHALAPRVGNRFLGNSDLTVDQAMMRVTAISRWFEPYGIKILADFRTEI